MLEIIEIMHSKNSIRGTTGRKIVVAGLPSTMNIQTEVMQSEFLVVIILRTLHHMLQIELGKFLQHYPQSCSFQPILYGPHCHRPLRSESEECWAYFIIDARFFNQKPMTA